MGSETRRHDMKHFLDGIKAGALCALLLCLWSFLTISSAQEASADWVGQLYVVTAFGFFGVPAVCYGILWGIAAGTWSLLLSSDWWCAVSSRLAEPDVDSKVASVLVAVPVNIAAVSLAAGGVHLAVTSRFVRPGFQALGLTVTVASSLVLVLVFTPALLEFIWRVLQRIPISYDERERSVLSRGLVFCYGVAGLALLVAAWWYATNLKVWSSQTLAMLATGIVATPLVLWFFVKKTGRALWWRYGVAISGLAVILVCFFLGAGFSSATPEMRQAVNKDSHLLALELRFLQRFGDADGDGYAARFGGFDCDDDNAAIYPGAREVVGNGVDEDCSGADMEALDVNDHPSRRLLRAAVRAGQAAAQKQAEEIPDPPKNLILILIDTLRYDHIQFAGYARPTTPNLDQLAAESVWFDRAYATSPHTPRSIPQIFLSRYPSHTAWRGGQYNYPKIRSRNLSLFEVLAQNDFENIGMTSHFYFKKKQGIRQGFGRWDNEGAGTIAESNDDIAAPRIFAKLSPVIDELGVRIKKDKTRFGLFVHFFEPHAKWIRHKEYDFGSGSSPEDRHRSAYDSEIAYVDAYLGRIISSLKAAGIYDESVLVVTSDHGEAFNEHGFFFHGQNLHNEVLHVPLLIRVPGWKPRRVTEPVSLVDIAPTVVDIFGIPLPVAFEGISLVPGMIGQGLPKGRPVFAELLPYTNWKEHHVAVIRDRYKLIDVRSAGTKQLYDLVEDPREQKNIIRKRPEVVQDLSKLLEEFSQRK
jgi:hypothetical protein